MIIIPKRDSRAGTAGSRLPPVLPPTASAHAHQTLERGFLLLEAIWRHGKPVNLARLSRMTGIERSVAHRLLASLVTLGYAHKNLDTKHYLLGHMSFRLGTRSHLLATITHQSRNFMSRLAAETGESVFLGMLEGTHVVYYDRILSKDEVPGGWSMADVGQLYDAHASALGKALLAMETPAEIRNRYQNTLLARHTAKTINSSAALSAELAEVASRGFAIESGETVIWRRGVAVAMVNPRGVATMGLAVLGPSARITDKRIPVLVAACRATVRDIYDHVVKARTPVKSD